MDFVQLSVESFLLDIKEKARRDDFGDSAGLVAEVTAALKVASVNIHDLPDDIHRLSFIAGWGMIEDDSGIAVVVLDKDGDLTAALTVRSFLAIVPPVYAHQTQRSS